MNSISVIIPACNEEKFIQNAIDSVRAAAEFAKVSYEIIVVLNRCSDNTENIAKENNCIITKCDEKNLSLIRNAGVKLANNEIIVTLDADSRLSKNFFSKAITALNKNAIGGATLIIPERISLGIMLTGLFLVPFVIFERISGGAFYCYKKDFWAINGFNPEMLSAEDIDFAKRLKAYGKSLGRHFVTLWSAYIITSCRKFDRFGDWYFLKNPRMVLNLLKGKDRRYADIVWYDFHKK
jgi:glycosyltransferase involved in cell wall biosynthesis